MAAIAGRRYSPVYDKLKKPEKWSFGKTKIDPNWQWVYDKAAIVWPLWARGGSAGNAPTAVEDLSGNKFNGSLISEGGGGPDWVVGSRGIELGFIINNKDRIEGGVVTTAVCDAECTCVVAHTIGSDVTSTQTLAFCGSVGTNSTFGLEFGRTDNKYTGLRNNEAVNITSNASFNAGAENVVCLRQSGSTGDWTSDLFINGLLDNTVASITNNPNTSATAECWNGAVKSPTPLNPLTGRISIIYWFPVALTDEQCRQLTLDPYGPIRESQTLFSFPDPATVSAPSIVGRSSFRPYDGLQAPKWPFTINMESPQAKGLAAWWPLTDGAVAKPIELAGNSVFEATIGSGLTSTHNTFGLGLAFTGSQGLRYTQSPQLKNIENNTGLGQGVSMTAWVKTNSSHQGSIVGRNAGAGQKDGPWFIIQVAQSLQVFNGASGVQSDTDIYAVNTWNLVGFTHEQKATDLVTWYVNGAIAGATDELVLVLTASTDPWYIGVDPRDGAGINLDADIFDIRVYNRVLTPQEMLAAYVPDTRWDLYEELGQRIFSFPATPPTSPSVGTRPSDLVEDKLKKPEGWG